MEVFIAVIPLGAVASRSGKRKSGHEVGVRVRPMDPHRTRYGPGWALNDHHDRPVRHADDASIERSKRHRSCLLFVGLPNSQNSSEGGHARCRLPGRDTLTGQTDEVVLDVFPGTTGASAADHAGGPGRARIATGPIESMAGQMDRAAEKPWGRTRQAGVTRAHVPRASGRRGSGHSIARCGIGARPRASSARHCVPGPGAARPPI